jgi:hypothetical protein
MGQRKTRRGIVARASLSAFALLVFLLAFSSQALADGPFHVREKALDVSGLNHACGAAVDSKGDLYAASAGDSKVKVYGPTDHKTPIAEIEDLHEPCGLAVTTSGDLYVSEQATGEVVRFKPNKYPFVGTPTYGSREVIDSSGTAKGIAVDAFDDKLFVAEGTYVAVYLNGVLYQVNERQRVEIEEATGGSFKLEFKGEATSPIAFGAEATAVKEALEALASIGPGGVEVTKIAATLYKVTFTGALAHTDVEALVGDASGLTGSGKQAVSVKEELKGFSGHAAEGKVSEATGVGVFSNPYVETGSLKESVRYLSVAEKGANDVKVFNALNSTEKGQGTLKLRRTLSGPNSKESFGFGAAGAAIAADSRTGHFAVYDASHSAVDEFDATGEFLDQTKNASLEALGDAQPSALAYDRSATQSPDGTLYVGAGPTSGAKLLAFAGLTTPTRELLKELSSKLTVEKALAAATDRYGDVYVAAATQVYVHDKTGKLLTSFEDELNPYALAVDSAGNVYVLDESGFNEGNLTYYEPSSFPPTASTTYSRHEPQLLEATANIESLAVNPANDHVFAGGRSGLQNGIEQWGSAEEGSPPIGGEPPIFAPFFSSVNGVKGLGVYGANGSVYVSDSNANPQFDVIDPEGTEFLSRSSGVCPAGETPDNVPIGLDQSDGHMLEFKTGQTKAREYDAAGVCVAEFGSFTTGFTGKGPIAVDNACTLHRNGEGKPEPLTGKACEEFDPSNGNAYFAFDGANNTIQPYDVTAFGPLDYGEAPPEEGEAAEAPIVTTGEADEFGPGEATLHGTVNPRGVLLEDCEFEYLPFAEYEENGEAFTGAESEECAESPEQIGSGTKAVAVHAQIEGLEANTAYAFRLAATNEGGTTAGEAETFGPPLIETQSAQPIFYDEATLRAKIDPFGFATEYRFEYGSEEGAYDQSTPVAELPAKHGFVEVKAPITGLKEGAEYHFRLVAANAVGREEGQDQSFETLVRRGQAECPNTEYRTGLSANLPDCRAYELVTVPDTHGLEFSTISSGSAGNIFNNWPVAPRGEGAGERISYAVGTLPGFNGSGDNDGYRSRRGNGAHPASGWTTELISFSFEQQGYRSGVHSEGTAADQEYSLWNTEPGTIFANTLARGRYLRTPVGSANPECNVPATKNPQPEFEVVGCGGLGVDPKAESRFVSSHGTHLVFFSAEHLEEEAAPNGTMAVYDREAGAHSAEVVSVKPDGSPFGEGEGATYVAASEDGGAVLFQVGGTLYLHREGETSEIAKSPNVFAGISEDGTRVFFAKTTTGSKPATLYACDVEAGPCTGGAPPGLTEIAAESVFVNVSADGSHAFFISEEGLTGPGQENEVGQHAEDGVDNLYEWDGAEIHFIAVAAGIDAALSNWTESINVGPNIGRGQSPTRATPDGGVFVFQSSAQLTAYENEGVEEIYRYAPAAPPGGRLLCVSCDPSGAPPGKGAVLQINNGTAFPHPNQSTIIPNVTDDGQEVFFQSYERLLPEDANGVADVYEWMAQGTGSGAEECKRQRGCLALISSGQGEAPSALMGMSADGSDVFFEMPEKLVPRDIPATQSIYDARVDGGIPPEATQSPCHGDACQGEGSTPPALASPASSAEVPEGNVEEPIARCPKGKRRVKGHCVKHHKRHRKHRAKHNRRAAR